MRKVRHSRAKNLHKKRNYWKRSYREYAFVFKPTGEKQDYKKRFWKANKIESKSEAISALEDVKRILSMCK